MNLSPICHTDFYKTSHPAQNPRDTILIYSNITGRKSRIEGVNHTVFFGLQYYVLEYLIYQWKEFFFDLPIGIVDEYEEFLKNTVGPTNVDHVRDLHKLGYLPIEIKALPEGTLCPIGVPMLTIRNTHPNFSWLTNYLETSISNILWKPITSATTAFEYLKTFHEYANRTGGSKELIPFQGHDFSYRGMSGFEDAALSGAAHLLSFKGTDTIPAIILLQKYYQAGKEGVGFSVPASEHAVAAAQTFAAMGEEYSPEERIRGEFEYVRNLIEEVYPKGIVSVVSDTYDYWLLVTDFLPRLKDKIMARDGKVVIRPDSGDPVRIICGYDIGVEVQEEQGSYYLNGEEIPRHVALGTVRILDEIFGSTTNEKGFKTLDPHIGVIYGDSITRDRQQEILARLERNGYASDNIVLGIGSYTYQYVTRDTFGMAIKATYTERMSNGTVIGADLFKDPKTDDGTKKSARGLLRVNEDFSLSQQVSWAEEKQGLLETVFKNGELVKTQTLEEISERVQCQIKQ